MALPGDVLSVGMAGTRSSLLGLVTRTTFLTVATLGVYGFWARTRIRRRLWSSLRVGGMPMEYAGRPLEKLMGFVIAAVIVAIYLGLVVMVLIFASLTLFASPAPGTAAAFALLIPVWWFAKYRGLRYLLDHTRWRGIAFSMRPGAWGYVWRAALWSLAAISSAGLLVPFRAHRLWRYRVKRTFYGDARFRLELPVRALYPHWLPVIGSVLVAAAAGAMIGQTAIGTAGWTAAGLVVLTGPAWVHWRVASFRLLMSGLRLGGATRLRVAPRTRTVIGIHLLGWLLMGLILLGAGIALTLGLGVAVAADLPRLDPETLLDGVPPWLLATGGILFYLTFFVARGALKIALVTFPLLRHVADTATLTGGIEVNAVRRGAASHMADADGFANLFDFGSAI